MYEDPPNREALVVDLYVLEEKQVARDNTTTSAELFANGTREYNAMAF